MGLTTLNCIVEFIEQPSEVLRHHPCPRPHNRRQLDSGDRARMLLAVVINRVRERPYAVIQFEAGTDVIVADRPSDSIRQLAAEALELCTSEIKRLPTVHILRQMQILNVQIRNVPLDQAGQVTGHVANRTEHRPLEVLHVAPQEEFECALGDRANKRLKARVRVGDLDLVAGAEQSHGHQARRVDDLQRGVHREHGEAADLRVLLARSRKRFARFELQQFGTTFDDRFNAHKVPPQSADSGHSPSAQNCNPPAPS